MPLLKGVFPAEHCHLIEPRRTPPPAYLCPETHPYALGFRACPPLFLEQDEGHGERMHKLFHEAYDLSGKRLEEGNSINKGLTSLGKASSTYLMAHGTRTRTRT